MDLLKHAFAVTQNKPCLRESFKLKWKKKKKKASALLSELKKIRWNQKHVYLLFLYVRAFEREREREKAHVFGLEH